MGRGNHPVDLYHDGEPPDDDQDGAKAEAGQETIKPISARLPLGTVLPATEERLRREAEMVAAATRTAKTKTRGKALDVTRASRRRAAQERGGRRKEGAQAGSQGDEGGTATGEEGHEGGLP